MPRTVTCAHCRSPFTGGQRRKFCSTVCYHTSKRNGPKKCVQCGSDFVPKSFTKSKHCSRECSIESQKLKARPRRCQECDSPYFSRERKQKFCSRDCFFKFNQKWNHPLFGKGKTKTYTCHNCNKEFTLDRHKSVRKFCSSPCSHEYRKNNDHWARREIGSLSVRSFLKGRRTEIYVKTEKGWRPQHQVVAEQQLGRELRDGEVVHHIDGNSCNNSYANIQVMVKEDHHKLHQDSYRLALWTMAYEASVVDRMISGC